MPSLKGEIHVPVTSHLHAHPCPWDKTGVPHELRLDLSRVGIFATPRTVAHRSPLPWGFPRQEYWSELPCPPLGDLQPRDRTQVSCTAGRFFTIWATGRLSLTWGLREWSWGCQVRSQNGKSLKVAVTGRAAPKGECKIISDLSLQAGQELHWFQGK